MSDHRTIYIVMGETGEYSDREQWPVRAFFSEEKAQWLVRAATERARELEVLRGDPRGKNEHDPDMTISYTGTSYFIIETILEDGEP